VKLPSTFKAVSHKKKAAVSSLLSNNEAADNVYFSFHAGRSCVEVSTDRKAVDIKGTKQTWLDTGKNRVKTLKLDVQA
jgi:hypothetical protein